MVPFLERVIHNVAGVLFHVHLLSVHTVFREVLNFDGFEITYTGVQRDFSPYHIVEFEAFEEFAAEMETGRRRGHGALHFCVVGLVALRVLFFYVAKFPQLIGQWGGADTFHGGHEIVVTTFVEETDCATARGGVVCHFGHQLVAAGTKIQFVADADFPCGVHHHVPQPSLVVELAQEENSDAGSGLLFFAHQERGENLCVVRHNHIFRLEIVNDVFEYAVFDLTGVAVYNHQA